MDLSVLHSIVINHGGDVIVQSGLGIGSTVQVVLLVIEWKLEPAVESIEITPRGTEKILFVDDEKSIVLAAKHKLE
ncbi:MAG: hypothetical protein SWO11_06590 [Thermodesulfobacteriota bacterium]|nr:hypothetical protein [Thermodesulfobacteriota bacterium]